ncbi:MAG TPA: hypothetical protein VGN63_13785 [Flavisolibacter sp.]|jgi:hypothetical protein|nr:hypothetical protein [Flavisolibacter sp.]
MKFFLLFSLSFLSLVCFAQIDSIRVIEPDKETSFENYELLAIAVVGLLLLIGIRFWFKRTRKH